MKYYAVVRRRDMAFGFTSSLQFRVPDNREYKCEHTRRLESL